MTLGEKQVQERLSLIFSDVIPVPLRKRQQTLVPNDGQFHRRGSGIQIRTRTIGISTFRRGRGAEAQEVEDESVDDLVGQGVLLLEERLDEDVGGAAALGRGRGLLRREVAEALQGSGGVQHGDGDAGQDGGDDVRFAQGAGAAGDEGEEEALEPRGGFVQGLLEGFE